MHAQDDPTLAGRPGYHIFTWGCQMNEEDSEQIGLFLEEMGYALVADPSQADVVMLNTCHVRQKPVDKVYSKLGELRLLKAERPNLIIGVCGCMAQVESALIKRRAPFVDMVVGTGNIAAIPELIAAAKAKRRPPAPNPGGVRTGQPQPGKAVTDSLQAHGSSHSPTSTNTVELPQDWGAGGRSERGRALEALSLPPRKGAIVADVPLRSVMRRPKLKAHVPISYGCDKFCTFCIVPHTRGRERSRPTAEIVAEIEGLARGGTKEVTLLGQTVNSYGKNMPEGRVPFARLLEMIDGIRGIRRIRFTSPYPRDFTDELIDGIARLPSVCEHVHLPLQVADDELLQRMHRGYTVEGYQRIVEKLREAIPGIAITTDVMLGFPGETDQQFLNTLQFVEKTRFDSAFMFAYSQRTGTAAADMADQVGKEVKVDRLNRLISLQNRITLEINKEQVGRTFEVLVEGRSPKDSAKLSGLTRTGKTVNFVGPESLIGRLVEVRAEAPHLWGFAGEPVG